MTQRKNRRPAPNEMRCAIYTRKSTEEGLEQEFNTLDAQREAGEAFIRSQQHEGWECLPDRYDDGGFTGGNMDRPALRRLMADIESGKVSKTSVWIRTGSTSQSYPTGKLSKTSRNGGRHCIHRSWRDPIHCQ